MMLIEFVICQKGLIDFLNLLLEDFWKKGYAWREFFEENLIKNHKVVIVRILSEKIDTCDLRVDKYHNFAVGQGVFVHNSGKSTLSHEDLRFARMVQRIQRVIESELMKVALIHLYVKGFDMEDLVSFDVSLNSPSTILDMQKAELMTNKFNLFRDAVTEKAISYDRARREILGLNDEDISNIKDELMSDAKFSQKLEMIAQGGEGGGGGMEAMLGGGGPEGGGGGGAPPPPDGGEQEGPFETESGRRRKDDKGDPDPIFPDEPYDPEGKTPYKLKKRYTHIEEEGTLQDTLIDAIDAELEDMDDRDVLTESVSGTDIFKRSLAQVQVLEAKKNKLFEGLESKRKKRYSPQYGLDTK